MKFTLCLGPSVLLSRKRKALGKGRRLLGEKHRGASCKKRDGFQNINSRSPFLPRKMHVILLHLCFQSLFHEYSSTAPTHYLSIHLPLLSHTHILTGYLFCALNYTYKIWYKTFHHIWKPATFFYLRLNPGINSLSLIIILYLSYLNLCLFTPVHYGTITSRL